MNKEIKQRLKWIKLYEETQNSGLVCRRCGISRPTLRKWLKRYEEHGLNGLKDASKRPHRSPKTKILRLGFSASEKIENSVQNEFKVSFFENMISNYPLPQFINSSLKMKLNL